MASSNAEKKWNSMNNTLNYKIIIAKKIIIGFNAGCSIFIFVFVSGTCLFELTLNLIIICNNFFISIIYLYTYILELVQSVHDDQMLKRLFEVG